MIELIASDGLKLKASLYPHSPSQKSSECLIVAPGFAQHSQTSVMRDICMHLASFCDVLCLDFRGTGESEGRFRFGGEEYLDVLSALRWAEANYTKVSLMGFSLGAYSSLRAAVLTEVSFHHLFLVSCPTSLDEIVWSGAFLKRSLEDLRIGTPLRRGQNFFFRWHNPFSAKPSAVKFAPELKAPVSFLVGERDLLTPIWMSQKVYEKVSVPGKTWKSIPTRGHAEELYFLEREAFTTWVKSTLQPVY